MARSSTRTCNGAVVLRTLAAVKEYMERQQLRQDLYEARWCNRHYGYHLWWVGKGQHD